MIEFKRIIPESSSSTNFDIYIDGKKHSYPEINGHLRDDKESSYFLILKSLDAIERFIPHRLIDLPGEAEYISLSFRPNYGFTIDFLDSISISENYERKLNEPDSRTEYEFVNLGTYNISYEFNPDLTEWKKEYSFTDYYNAYSKAFEKITDSSINFGMQDPEGGIQHGFFVRFAEFNSEKPIVESIKNHLILLRELHFEAEAEIARNLNQNSVALSIEIPDEIRAPYSQYLSYFSQFLADLGVKAALDIHNDASKILFTVTPNDSSEALDKIRAALEIYLCLPNSPISDYAEISTDIEVQRLTANVQHLKSQLTLAKAERQLNEAVIEAKDTTIQVLRFTVSQQKQLLNGDISSGIIDITPHAANSEKDKEDLIEGIVSLTTYDGNGFEISLAEIFRRLKQAFKKK